jgi:hypothetical protein
MKFRISYKLILCVCLSIGLSNTNLISSIYAAQRNTEEELQQNVPSTIDGKISNIINVPGYTYVEVETGNDKVWAAVPSTSVNIGDEVSFSNGTPMQNFYSKTLQRDFPVIYFVDRFVTDNRVIKMSAAASAAHGQFSQEPAAGLIKEINKVESGNTIAEIHARKDELDGDTIRVRGQVTRFTADILEKNWIHIRDSSTTNDLTVTTDATVAIDDVVIIEGKLELDKNYGYGYVYPVILEDAKITKE